MKRLLFVFVLVAVAWGASSYADFAGSGFSSTGGSSLPSQTGNNGKYLTTNGTSASWGTPAVGGTVTGPATATENNMATWGADNVTLKDSGVAVPNQALSTTSSPTFTAVTAGEFISSAADNTRGVTVPNTADPTGANLAAGKIWVTDNSVKVRSNDNTVTFIAGSLIKTFSFAIDNVIASDNVLLTRVPRAWTLTRADCYASYDNVVGSLMECAADNVTSCTVLDSWTVTNAVSPFTDSTMTDGAVAAGAWVRWSTTSVGTASLNNFLCTVQYRE